MIKNYLTLFFTWFKMGLFTFGGGYAMLPMIQREIVEKREWASEEEIMEYYAIGQCTPGVIAVNTASFVGVKLYGVVGAIVATLGLVCPSLIIITFIATVLSNFNEIEVVQHALKGINISACVLMTISIVRLIKFNVNDLTGLIIFVFVFIAAMFIGVKTIYLVIVAGIIGIIIKAIQTRKEVKEHE